MIPNRYDYYIALIITIIHFLIDYILKYSIFQIYNIKDFIINNMPDGWTFFYHLPLN